MKELNPLRLNVWSGPRNISTALMYSFAQRSDTRVYDEPLYAHYLRVTGIDHPGREETLASMEQDGAKVVEQLILREKAAPLMFFKQMTKHLVALDWDFLTQTTHIFLIRHPDRVLKSYGKVISQPNADDVGYKQQYEMWEQLVAAGTPTVVLDGEEVRTRPEVLLKALCAHLEIPFEPAMLSWPAGPRPEDGTWAKYWYAAVHQSTGFAPYVHQEVELAPHLARVSAELMPYYERLYAHALKANK